MQSQSPRHPVPPWLPSAIPIAIAIVIVIIRQAFPLARPRGLLTRPASQAWGVI